MNANMHKNILPTRVTACAVGAVYGLRLIMVQPIAGLIVCGAFAIIWSAVELGWPLESI